MKKPKKKSELDLQWKIVGGIIAGIFLGLIFNKTFGPDIQSGTGFVLKVVFGYGGDIFIRLLKMLIIPLVFASIFMAIINVGNLREIGKIGLKTVMYYLITTALAVVVGMLLVNIIHPGVGIDQGVLSNLNIHTSVPEKVSTQNVAERGAFVIIIDTLIDMIPKNPIAAMAKGDILQVIFFTIFFAIITGLVGKESEAIVNVVAGLDKIMMRAVMVIMVIAPYCIFFIVTAIFMDLGIEAFVALGKYAITVLLGLTIHAGITLPLLVMIFGRYNPFGLLKAVSPAIMTAWTTASSAATLPLTMDCLEKRAGVERRIGDFVLPLGATVNMDGTALYESVAVIFIAELLGIHVTIGTQIVIFFTATLAAIGAAAIPSAGLVTMGIVLTAAGLPLEGIGLILAIDRVLDQFRTAVNVWGDTSIAVIIGRMENAIIQKREDMSPHNTTNSS